MGGADWTIIDTETTGIAAPIYTLEIAAQRMRGLVPIGKPFQVFLNHEVDVPREAQAIHGYSRQFLQQNGKSPRLAHQSFAEYVGGTPLAAYNLPYDYDKVLVPEWKRLGIQTGIPRGFCVMRLTQKLFSPSPAGNYKLQSLRAHFRLPERDAHSALGDVLTVVDLLGAALLPHLQRLGLGDATAIGRYLDGSGYPDHLPFGKHKGRHWKEAVSDRDMLGWLQWLARQDDGNSSKMAEWYLAQVKKQNESGSSKPSQTVAIERTNIACPHCFKMLAIPKGRSGTVDCPSCKSEYYYNAEKNIIEKSNEKEKNKTEESAIKFDKNLILKNNDAENYFHSGNALSDLGEYNRAIIDYNEAIRLKSDYAYSYNNRGNAWLDKGDYDRAIADYDEAIRLNPSYAEAYNNRGIAWSDKAEYDRAIEDYNRALHLIKNDAEIYVNRGNAWLDKGDYDRAIADYDEAIRLNPSYAEAYNNRGIAWSDKAEYDRAIDDYEVVLSLKSQSINTYNNRIENQNINNKENFGIEKTTVDLYKETEQYKKLSKLKKEILKEPLGKFGERAFEYRCGHCNSSSQHFYYEKKNVVRCQQCGFEIIIE